MRARAGTVCLIGLFAVGCQPEAGPETQHEPQPGPGSEGEGEGEGEPEPGPDAGPQPADAGGDPVVDAGAPDAGDTTAPDAGEPDAGDTPPPTSGVAALLQTAVRFYGAQRCGDTHNWLIADHPLGNTCHMEDGPGLAPDVDLVGGWHDAGDYIKFTLTTAWSAYVLLKAYEAFPLAFGDLDDGAYSGAPNGVPDVLDEVRVATDYLLKVHPDADTFVARVGGNQDHDNFVTSPFQSTLTVDEGGGARPVTVEANADIAGITAAALALASVVYEPFDPDHAADCLATASGAYAYAQDHPGTTPDNFYSDDSYEDGLMCAAVELHRATQDPALLDAAIAYHEALGQHYWVVDWASQHDYCRHSLYLAGHTDVLDVWGADVRSYLDTVSNDEYVKGLAFFINWGSLRYATGAAFSAALYATVTDDSEVRDFALSQLAYVMGDNEYERSFVVGWGENPPTKPHHANAYGYDDLRFDPTLPPRHSLDGALVGGPMKTSEENFPAGYEDDVENWIANEVTLDYNSGLVGVAAFASTCDCFEAGEPDPGPDPGPAPACDAVGAFTPPEGMSARVEIDAPDPCSSQFWVGDCEEGDADSACGGVCTVANACSPPEDPGKADYAMTYMCPRLMALGPEMLEAADMDASARAWAANDGAPFAYGVVGHDPDPDVDGDVESTCCQCYQLVFELPEEGSPQPPALPIPKPMIVQSFDTAAGGGRNFDIYVGAGGFGAFNTCYDYPGYPTNSVFGQFMYTDYPTEVSDEGNIGFVDIPECGEDGDITIDTLESCACQDRVTELCGEAISPDAWTTYSTGLSCASTNQVGSLYHQNWEVRVRKVECPEALTRVTGCRLQPAGLAEPDPAVRAVTDIDPGDATWHSGYTTTTTQDCCMPSCSWQDWVSGKGLAVEQPWNAIYSCNQLGQPVLAGGEQGAPVCPVGFDGEDCARNIDDCADDPCDNGGRCIDGIASYTCECLDGWAGPDCSIACPDGDCALGGVWVQITEDSAWDDGFTAYVGITNHDDDAVDGWSLSCTFGFTVDEAWNATWEHEGNQHTFSSEGWNDVIAPGDTYEVGMSCTGVLSDDNVQGCALNGAPVNVVVAR